MLHRNFTLIPTRASYVMKKGYGGAEKIAHAQKKYHEIVSIVLWLKEYFKGFFFPNRILRNELYLFMYIVHNEYSVITANCF